MYWALIGILTGVESAELRLFLIIVAFASLALIWLLRLQFLILLCLMSTGIALVFGIHYYHRSFPTYILPEDVAQQVVVVSEPTPGIQPDHFPYFGYNEPSEAAILRNDSKLLAGEELYLACLDGRGGLGIVLLQRKRYYAWEEIQKEKQFAPRPGAGEQEVHFEPVAQQYIDVEATPGAHEPTDGTSFYNCRAGETAKDAYDALLHPVRTAKR